MTALVRKYSLFYLAHAVTFFFLCAYSMAANTPNFPFLPALFFPIYLSSAVALSERETGDPLLNILPVSPGEIMKVKFVLAFVFVVIGWLNMALFTVLQGLDPFLIKPIMTLNTLCSIFTLLLAAAFQLGIQFFGWSVFRKVIILCVVLFSVFGIVFFLGLAESGHNHPEDFPLVPVLNALPTALLVMISALALAAFYLVLNFGPWNPRPHARGEVL